MYYLGVDVGGTNIAVGIVDENNAIIAKASHPTPVPCSEDAFCDAILAVCNDALAKAGLTLDDVPWIGIGCPGTVNRATGIIEFANNLYFKNFKLRDMMAERTNGKLVILENDANAAAYGEYQAGAERLDKMRSYIFNSVLLTALFAVLITAIHRKSNHSVGR